MARYRLTSPHYLKVQGTEWEQTELDMVTGKQVRKRYSVPMYLDPDKDPTCLNYPGECIVSSKADPLFPRDLVFDGPPTLEMTPLDDEAVAEVERQMKRGEHPIESLPGQLFSETLLAKLQAQVDKAALNPSPSEDRIATLERQLEDLKALLNGAKPLARVSL